MSERGGSCRPTQRRGPREAEPFEVKLDGEAVQIELRGRRVRTLVGDEAAELRHALEAGDDARVQQIAARKVSFARGREE